MRSKPASPRSRRCPRRSTSRPRRPARASSSTQQMGVTPADIDVTPGKHTSSSSSRLPPDRSRSDVSYGGKQDVKSELQAKPAELPPTPRSRRTRPRRTSRPNRPPPEPPKEKPSIPPHHRWPRGRRGGRRNGFGILAFGKQSDSSRAPTPTPRTRARTSRSWPHVLRHRDHARCDDLVLFLTNDEPAKPRRPFR